jgi:hypothetical protein
VYAQEMGLGEGLVGLLAEKLKMALLSAEKKCKSDQMLHILVGTYHPTITHIFPFQPYVPCALEMKDTFNVCICAPDMLPILVAYHLAEAASNKLFNATYPTKPNFCCHPSKIFFAL